MVFPGVISGDKVAHPGTKTMWHAPGSHESKKRCVRKRKSFRLLLLLCSGPQVIPSPMLGQSSVSLTTECAGLRGRSRFQKGMLSLSLSVSQSSIHSQKHSTVSLSWLPLLRKDRIPMILLQKMDCQAVLWVGERLACTPEDNIETKAREPTTLTWQLSPGHGRTIAHNQASSPGS